MWSSLHCAVDYKIDMEVAWCYLQRVISSYFSNLLALMLVYDMAKGVVV